MTTRWDAYRAANPMLAEMCEYNTRVIDRVMAKKTKKLTAPRDVMDGKDGKSKVEQDLDQLEVQDRTDGPDAFGPSRIVFSDRYSAMGMAQPDPKTMCRGQCEGTGLVPVHGRDWKDPNPKKGSVRPIRPKDEDWTAEDEQYEKLWQEAEKKHATDDGYHFVKCIDCGGSGKKGTKPKKEGVDGFVADLQALMGEDGAA